MCRASQSQSGEKNLLFRIECSQEGYSHLTDLRLMDIDALARVLTLLMRVSGGFSIKTDADR